SCTSPAATGCGRVLASTIRGGRRRVIAAAKPPLFARVIFIARSPVRAFALDGIWALELLLSLYFLRSPLCFQRTDVLDQHLDLCGQRLDLLGQARQRVRFPPGRRGSATTAPRGAHRQGTADPDADLTPGGQHRLLFSAAGPVQRSGLCEGSIGKF